MTTILLVGAADTGRAPIAAALLRRLLERQNLNWTVGSAGVLGHDDAPPETEARDTLAHLGLDLSQHRARSITDELATEAALLIAIDSGIARALRARFPTAGDRIATLGELASRPRDIPDPFRMQMGAWLTYARELALLLEAALPAMIERGGQSAAAPHAAPPTPAADAVTQRHTAVVRLARLFQVFGEIPDAISWPAVLPYIEAQLGSASAPFAPDDLAVAYAGVLRAALALTASPPTDGQLAALQQAVERLGAPVSHEDITGLSGQLGGWAGL